MVQSKAKGVRPTVRDSLTYDSQEEEKAEEARKEGTVHTHTSPSILCSWDWTPAKPTMRVSTPRAPRAATILTASAKAGLMASQGPSSAGSLAAKISISLHVGRAPDDQGLHNFSHVLVLGYIWLLFIKLNAKSYVHSNLSHNALYNICKSLNAMKYGA